MLPARHHCSLSTYSNYIIIMSEHMIGWHFEIYAVLILIKRQNQLHNEEPRSVIGGNVCGDRGISQNLIPNFLKDTPRRLQQLHQLKLANIPSPTPNSLILSCETKKKKK